ncbi:MAG: class I SAM-dependent methyltransferase [Deltaproteobacteria bacterium]|nr:class I SAM-dependent methyltransferase [Deltaproteobacteria bacterium]
MARMRSEAIKQLIWGYGRAELALERGKVAGRRFLQGLASVALSAAEREEIGLRIYDRGFRPDRVERGLYDWERPWFAEVLPPPPARILLGGAGEGREVVSLLAQGYRVTAFEPGPRSAAHCAQRAGARGVVLCGRYADLTDAVLRSRSTPLSCLAHERFDAVILGWGSFTHVFPRSARGELLEAACRLSPDGPILASFFMRSSGAPKVSRAERAGQAFGRLLDRRAEPSERLEFVPHLGFAYSFTREEIEELGAALGRCTEWGPKGVYPHAAWLRRRASATRSS